MSSTSGNKKKLLVVDDDQVTLKLLKMILSKEGYHVDTFGSGFEAQDYLREEGEPNYDCMITDFNMPRVNGLELVRWVHDLDASLAAILLTADGDKKTVSQALKNGVHDFLDKPIRKDILLDAVEKAIGQTRQQRFYQSVASEVRDITDIYDRLSVSAEVDDSQQNDYWPTVVTRFYPIKETGGDFLNTFASDADRVMVLAGDVSGHDLKAGFISTYCQGMVRGMVDMGADISTICDRFNHFLVNVWNDVPSTAGSISVKTSLASCFILFDLANKEMHMINGGFPLPIMSGEEDLYAPLGENAPPLGWFYPMLCETQLIPMKERAYCYLWSDGLEDLAADLQMTQCALAFYLINEEEASKRAELISDRTDDILVSRIHWDACPDSEAPVWEAFFGETYDGDDFNAVDRYQKVWENSMTLALPHVYQEKVNEILLCLREAVLNGLMHGCRGEKAKKCHVYGAVSEDRDRMRLQVVDDGKGFEETSANDGDESHVSLGLIILQSYTTYCEHSMDGRCLTLEFDLTSTPPPS